MNCISLKLILRTFLFLFFFLLLLLNKIDYDQISETGENYIYDLQYESK